MLCHQIKHLANQACSFLAGVNKEKRGEAILSQWPLSRTRVTFPIVDVNYGFNYDSYG